MSASTAPGGRRCSDRHVSSNGTLAARGGSRRAAAVRLRESSAERDSHHSPHVSEENGGCPSWHRPRSCGSPLAPRTARRPPRGRSGGRDMVKVRAFRTLENSFRRMGFNHVAGVDEVGRGCLAGPVVAAAVVLNPERYVPRVCDSKTVTALERERLYVSITRAAVAWGVAAAEPAEIDSINIHQASLRAMQRAVLSLCPAPDCVLVDAFRIPDLL